MCSCTIEPGRSHKVLAAALAMGSRAFKGEPSDLLVLDLAVGVARKQTVAARLRGWASLLRRTGWFRSAGQWPRWARLSISASPRHLIYAAAVQLFWSVP